MDAVTPPKPHVLVEAQPFIPYVKEENLNPARLKQVLDPYKKRMGFLPNALKLYAHRPEGAERCGASTARSCAIQPRRSISCLFKRKLAAVACATNGCAYCTAHSVKRSIFSLVNRWFMDPLIAPALNQQRRRLGLPPVSRVFNAWLHSPRGQRVHFGSALVR